MERQKTLFLSELYPPIYGGTPVMFSSRFGLYPPEKIIVMTKPVAQAEAFDRSVAYPIKRVPLPWRGPKGFEYMGVVWALMKAAVPVILKERVNVIECARPLPEGIAGYALATLLRKKLIVNYHGEDIAVMQNYRVERMLMRRGSRAAHLNLANSRNTETLVRALGGPRIRTGVIAPGFNADALTPPEPKDVAALRAQLGGGPLVLTVGRLQRRKGQDQVIRALPEVVKQFPDLRYVIVGSPVGGTAGLEADLLQLAEEFGVRRNLVMVGEIAREQLACHYAACDLFIMANREEGLGDIEGFGIVFLEAGFFGKPVIGGISGGVPDAVQDGRTGLLVDGTSPPAIAQALTTILANQELAMRMGQTGREFALTLTHERVFAQYCDLLTSLGI